MKAVSAILAAGLMIGCSQAPSEVSVAEDFWAAMAANDSPAVRELISVPEQVAILEGAVWEAEGYEVLALTDEGVEVAVSSDCYKDMVYPTAITDVDGEPKVDLRKTLLEGAKASANKEPKRQYCYEFIDQPLQGKINGEPWTAHHMNRAIYDFGTRKSEKLKIVSEPCEDKWCNDLTSSAIHLNLDLSGNGGDFNSTDNITLFTPPGSNEIITEGSYRVSQAEDGQIKLEISFKHDAGNTANGFIKFPADDSSPEG